MSKALLREYYALCEGGVCQDLLTLIFIYLSPIKRALPVRAKIPYSN